MQQGWIEGLDKKCLSRGKALIYKRIPLKLNVFFTILACLSLSMLYFVIIHVSFTSVNYFKRERLNCVVTLMNYSEYEPWVLSRFSAEFFLPICVCVCFLAGSLRNPI